jgi:phage shock protein PspC (stress-responsive transcriptional regulator)
MVLADELNKLAELRANGGLTEEEFTLAKERVMNGEPARCSESMAGSVNRFRLSRTDRWIGGVCGGLGRLTGLESWIWRLLFTVLFLLGGTGVVLYLLLWIFVPNAEGMTSRPAGAEGRKECHAV